MVQIQLESGACFACDNDDVILRAGLRQGVAIPYECASGGCGTCKIQVLEGEFQLAWGKAPGLSERDQRKNRQLACQCRPTTNCRIKVQTDDRYLPKYLPMKQKADLIKVKSVTHDILEFYFKLEHIAQFIPGQYMMLRVNGKDERAYSMANLPNEEKIVVFQIRIVPGGKVSRYLFDKAQREKTTFEVDGPFGVAYLRNTDKNVVCIAGGSGLAPMLSIARGIASDPTFASQRVWFFHGGREERDLLNHEKIRELTGLDGQIVYISATSERAANNHEIRMGYIHDVVESLLGKRLVEHEVYCAGPPGMVAAVEGLAHEKGMHANNIHCDHFY